MTLEIDAEVARNYATIKADENVTWEQLASRFDPGTNAPDAYLAAWMREQPEEGVLNTTQQAVATRRPRRTATPTAPQRTTGDVPVDPAVDPAVEPVEPVEPAVEPVDPASVQPVEEPVSAAS